MRVTRNPAKAGRASGRQRCTSVPSTTREWITPEMVRRLLATSWTATAIDPAITSLVDTNELWFVPVVNVDGYDITFSDPDCGCGARTSATPTATASSRPARASTSTATSRPTGATTTKVRRPTRSTTRIAARPGIGTRDPGAQLALFELAKPEFLVNYHSAAELLLYGVGWQVATPSPDDVIYEAMAGDDANPAVPGYDPDLSAELYTVNGDTDDHAQNAYGILAFTPEMATCETASAVGPERRL